MAADPRMWPASRKRAKPQARAESNAVVDRRTGPWPAGIRRGVYLNQWFAAAGASYWVGRVPGCGVAASRRTGHGGAGGVDGPLKPWRQGRGYSHVIDSVRKDEAIRLQGRAGECRLRSFDSARRPGSAAIQENARPFTSRGASRPVTAGCAQKRFSNLATPRPTPISDPASVYPVGWRSEVPRHAGEDHHRDLVLTRCPASPRAHRIASR